MAQVLELPYVPGGVSITDAAANTSTIYSMSAGDQFLGKHDNNFDTDWVKISLTAGVDYDIFVNKSGDFPASSPYVRLYDSSGAQITLRDWLDVEGHESHLRFTPPTTSGASTTGTYYVAVTDYVPYINGTYTMAVNVDAPTLPSLPALVAPAPGSPEAALYTGKRVTPKDATDNPFEIKYYFAPEGTSLSTRTANATWNAFEKAQAREAMEQWAAVTGLTFTEVDSQNESNFLFGLTSLPTSGESSFPNDLGSDQLVMFNRDYYGWEEDGGAGLMKGGFGFNVLLHEIGHALGLAHPFDADGPSEIWKDVEKSGFDTYTTGQDGLNDGVFTVMSYNKGSAELGPSGRPNYGEAATPMALDIAVVQRLYGANPNFNNGDTVYTLPSENADGTHFAAIFDTGGEDTILNATAKAAVIDLRDATLLGEKGGGGFLSYVDSVKGGFTIANGVRIENATGSSEGDTLIGNALNNTLSGMDGQDTVSGGSGADTVTGGAAADTFSGTLAEMFGDTVTDFSVDDMLVFKGAVFGRSDIAMAPGSTSLGVDANKDGTEDGSITLLGDYSDGEFMAIGSGGDTFVSFETRLPGLVEGQAVDPSMVNGVNNQHFLTGDGSTDFRITLREDLGLAGFENILGVYEVDASGNLVDTRMVFTNANADKSAQTTITDVQAGNSLGFFIVQNAAGLASTFTDTDTFGFVNSVGAAANLSDGSDIYFQLNGSTEDVTVFHSYSEAMNSDGLEHAVSGVNSGGNSITIGFEDQTGGGDRDYGDVAFNVETFDSPM